MRNMVGSSSSRHATCCGASVGDMKRRRAVDVVVVVVAVVVDDGGRRSRGGGPAHGATVAPREPSSRSSYFVFASRCELGGVLVRTEEKESWSISPLLGPC